MRTQGVVVGVGHEDLRRQCDIISDLDVHKGEDDDPRVEEDTVTKHDAARTTEMRRAVVRPDQRVISDVQIGIRDEWTTEYARTST